MSRYMAESERISAGVRIRASRGWLNRRPSAIKSPHSAALKMAAGDTAVYLKHLHKQLNTRRLSFASSEMLMEKLGLVQGSVTPFGILNDDTREVTLVFDERLAHERFDAHPMVNTATMFIHMDEVLPLLEEHGNPVVCCDLTCQVTR